MEGEVINQLTAQIPEGFIIKCRHDYSKEVDGKYVCSKCGKIGRLILNKTDDDVILSGIKKDGLKYSVRKDRHRYFMPQEWKDFEKSLTNEKHRILFLTLLHTGARIMEALHLKPSSFDFERGTIKFDVVKQRKAKRQFYSLGTTRMFFVSPNYLKEIKSYVRKNDIKDNEFIFLNNSTLPTNYNELSHQERKK